MTKKRMNVGAESRKGSKWWLMYDTILSQYRAFLGIITTYRNPEIKGHKCVLPVVSVWQDF